LKSREKTGLFIQNEAVPKPRLMTSHHTPQVRQRSLSLLLRNILLNTSALRKILASAKESIDYPADKMPAV